MKNFASRLLFLFVSFTLILSCKKNGLTKATQNGANTFSCKVDGNTYIAELSAFSFARSPIAVFNFQQDGFSISTIDARTGNPINSRLVTIQLPTYKLQELIL